MTKRAIKWLLVIGFMICIFAFSNEPAIVSDEKSRFVIYVFNLIGINMESAFGTLANFIVRKAAHFMEYFALYLLVFNAIYNDFDKKISLKYALIIVFLYSVSDEFHQLFIPGRAGRIRDVIIDTSGGVLGLILMKFFATEKSISNKKIFQKDLV